MNLTIGVFIYSLKYERAFSVVRMSRRHVSEVDSGKLTHTQSRTYGNKVIVSTKEINLLLRRTKAYTNIPVGRNAHPFGGSRSTTMKSDDSRCVSCCNGHSSSPSCTICSEDG